MSKKTYKTKPVLKVNEWSVDQGGGTYISFAEYLDIPGLEHADIRIEFDKNLTIDEVSELASKLKRAGFTFVIQK